MTAGGLDGLHGEAQEAVGVREGLLEGGLRLLPGAVLRRQGGPDDQLELRQVTHGAYGKGRVDRDSLL
jgi:hypothetical protein